MMTVPPALDDDPAQIIFLRRLLTWLGAVTVTFSVVLSSTLVLFHDTRKGEIGIALAVFCVLLIIVRSRMDQQPISQSVATLCGGLLILNLALTLIDPYYLEITLPLLIVAIALPYLRGRSLRRLIIGCWCAAMLVIFWIEQQQHIHAPSASPLWFDIVLSLLGNSVLFGTILVLLWHFVQTTRTILAEAHEREARFQTLSELTSDYTYKVIIAPDGENRVVWHGGAITRVLGYTVERLEELPQGFLSIVHPDDHALAMQRRVRVLNNQSDVAELRIVHGSGAIRWLRLYTHPEWSVAEQRVVSAVGAMQDITEQKDYQQQIEQLAFYDALTGLANRRLLHTRLTAALTAAAQRNAPLTVLYFDLDRFKSVNDTLGHDVGDALLVQIAARMRGWVRADDLLARLGGDEFALILFDTDEVQAVSAAQCITAQLEADFVVAGHTLHIRQSIGIACFPHDGASMDVLLRHADIAMYHAKLHRSPYQRYTPTLDRARQTQLLLEAELRRAIQHNELTLYYQPIYDMQAQQIARVEALARWQHPARGLLLPDAFIPLAEECGLIRALDRWVLRHALEQAAHWSARYPTLVVSINLSVQSLQDQEIVAYVGGCLAETSAPAHCIAIEITESAVMRDPAAAALALHGLKALGLSIAIDDFGCGYTSLAHLTRLPIDVLKIDRDFVRGIGNNPKSEGVLTALMTLGRNLRLVVVAEGVERAEQLDWLHLSCYDFAQGYLIGYPVPPDELTDLPLGKRQIMHTPVGNGSAHATTQA